MSVAKQKMLEAMRRELVADIEYSSSIVRETGISSEFARGVQAGLSLATDLVMDFFEELWEGLDDG